MVGAVLVVVLVLVLGGCACVVWAERGGPRWVRLVSRATLGAGGLVRRVERDRRRRGLSNGSGDSGD
ncbi:hypothetical protein [Kitasatospora phosalacinea]|uniref:hypothetical protein n=1 Tax=Kitasatospora phosalacinea TaxID=2065 RepID=UPI000523FC91|nr:hypothetical protein [Kitasatospora phosalacinea]